jgi:PPOX class probable F420-dependent enzyme
VTVAGHAVHVPDSHRDLLDRPICGVLTTLLRDGQPHSTLVWLDADVDVVRVNTTLERQSGRNLASDPRACVLVVDPKDTSRFIQLRGDVEVVRAGALRHLDELTRRYTGHPRFYGYVYPTEQAARETRVIAVLHPIRVSVDAIHR